MYCNNYIITVFLYSDYIIYYISSIKNEPMTSAIFNELIFRGFEVKYGTFRNGEIDFVVLKNKKK